MMRTCACRLALVLSTSNSPETTCAIFSRLFKVSIMEESAHYIRLTNTQSVSRRKHLRVPLHFRARRKHCTITAARKCRTSFVTG